MKLVDFFSYRINRNIFTAFIMIILIPGIVSFLVTSNIIRKSQEQEIESRLTEAGIVYFEELDSIERKCIDIATVYSRKDSVSDQIFSGSYHLLEKDLIDFYSMNLIDIVEVEDTSGRVLFRGHNPESAGDIKINQDVVQKGLSGKTSLSYEHGNSGMAIRAVAPVFRDSKVIGVFMAGSLFSKDFVNRLKSLTLLDNGIYRGSKKIVSTYEGMDSLDKETIAGLAAGKSIIKLDEQLNGDIRNFILWPVFLNNEYWGAVLLGIDNSQIDRSHSYTSNQLIYLVALGFLLALLIYFYLARNINASISRIITGISDLSFDHPNKPIRQIRGDEFGIIADNYNLLIKKLEIYNNRIHSLQNDLVESTRLATAGQIAAGLAHEIRNPLSSIKMMAQIINSRFLEPGKGTSEMEIILEEIDRINIKVTELLEFARPGELEKKSCDVNSIMNGVLNLCFYMIRERNIELIKDYGGKQVLLTADSEKLRICFLNIIINAIQVMESGEKLRINIMKNGSVAEIRICNSGSYINHEDRDKLFEPFYTKRDGGTGLGLSISKIIIERHNGSIEFSDEDELVCFIIKIPDPETKGSL